ncbi:MAG: tRNA lysidine(34) synthetase TilS [Lachnospira sp.]
MENFIDKIRNYIEANKMLEDCTDVIVGLSGGADSVCLLLVLKRIIESGDRNIAIHAVHVNHGIRREAERDAYFSQELCERLKVDFQCVKCDIPALAAIRKMTLEETGRAERYRIFRECKSKYKHAVVAVAHHSNDQAETVIMNMARGCTLKGLGGIRPVNNEIIRPLLCVNRTQIESFLREQGQEYVTDSTNADNSYTRNAVRNVILPAMEENINSNSVSNIVKAAMWAREADDFIGRLADKEYESCVTHLQDGESIRIAVGRFAGLDHIIRTRIIYRCITEIAGCVKDFTGNHVDAVDSLLDMQVGKTVYVGRGITAGREYDAILIRITGEDKFDDVESESLVRSLSIKELCEGDVDLILDADIFDGDSGLEHVGTIHFSIKNKEELCGKDINRCYAKFFDCDKIKGSNLLVRFRRTGDYIIVGNSGESRKLKKEFIDRKIPQSLRDNVLLVCDEQEVLVAWNVRRSQSALVDLDTKRILVISIGESV